ncbi:hypothetical protein WJX84_001791 [Apatococcus fuscideae]|uniref:Programmed cell death protein 2 C-terminal domain-containing protein n=1 Tax=Apatococcus fuscideae TaxID=2026836 RepID=A0AAW1SJW9_9CHLO
MPGDMLATDDPGDLFSTRVGGELLCSGTAPPELASTVNCKICGGHLSPVLQAFAPLSKPQVDGDIPNRFLYILGCLATGCGVESGSWRALRHQPASTASSAGGAEPKAKLPPQPLVPQASPQQTEPAGADDHNSLDGNSGWGRDLDSWGDEATSEVARGASSGNPLDFSDLGAALDELGPISHERSGTSACSPHHNAALESEHDYRDTTSCVAELQGLRLPAFLLWAQAEPEAQPGRMRLSAAHKQHIAGLLSSYEAQADEALPTHAQGCQTRQGDAETTPADAWSGEDYVRDESKGCDAPLVKFLKRVQRCPDQCARYQFDSSVLWPSAQDPGMSSCEACGAPRVFEMQLMSPLMHSMHEAADWAACDNEEEVPRPPDSWQWLTIALFTCSKSCRNIQDGSSLVEEQLVLFNE